MRAFPKKTAANTLLSADSHHLDWSKNEIPVDQFQTIQKKKTKNRKRAIYHSL